MKTILTAFILLSFTHVSGQKINKDYRIHVHRSELPVKVDGNANDPAWQTAEMADSFFMMTPMDTSKSTARTTVQFCYDEKNLYVVAVCYKPSPGENMVESLRRDFNFSKNDNFIFFLDTFDDLTSGLSFGANAEGAQWDGMMYEGGKMDLNWDNKWTSVVKNDGDKYVFEAAIPFQTLRYKKGIREWGLNLSRNDLKLPEKSSWAPVPRQFPSAALAYTGTLVWDEEPPPPGPNISIIPYTLGNMSKDYEKDDPTKFHGEIGGDIKIGVTSSLNLDLTINPDFSQVEVDRQVTNLDRFELFFPERRQFFLENGDLFANFGYASIRPFFSRRIGLEAPIIAGARFSGKLNKDWRIGAMNMQTGKSEENGLPAQNFTVLSLQRRLFKRSNIGIIAVNKQSPGDFSDTLPGKPISKYNRNLGLEYNLASGNNKWTGKAMLVKSFSPNVSGSDWVHAANLQYASKRLIAGWQHEYVGHNYSAEVGYVPRKGYIKMNPYFTYLFFPKKGPILSHGIGVNSTYYFNEQWKNIDYHNVIPYTITFRNGSTFSPLVQSDYVYLTAPFDPTNSGKDTLARGTEHYANTTGFDFISTPKKKFTFSLNSRIGGYYADGHKFSIGGEIGYRFQPYAALSLALTYNDLRMPAPWNRTQLWIVSPRIDITFTNNFFFTTFFQFNNQAKNININSRLQWRYRPASDIYLVFTDNYYPDPFGVKNRALVLKITYWWNT
jgi:hypothetical protein